MTSTNCANCGVAHGPDDMFCENCGYDFITGSMPPQEGEAGGPVAPAPSVLAAPDPGAGPTADGGGDGGSGDPDAADADAAPDPGAAAPGDPSAVEVSRVRIEVAVDRDYFDAVVNDGEIDFPETVAADQELDIAGPEIHIGRTSESRAIHPDIDVADLTGDQAVSSRHAVLRVADDGTLTLIDVGSTNGTFIDAIDSGAITQGVPIEVKAGAPIYVGAWTRLTVLDDV